MRTWYQTLFLSSYLGSSIGSVKHLVLRSRKTGKQTRHNLVKRNSQSNVNKSLPFQLCVTHSRCGADKSSYKSYNTCCDVMDRRCELWKLWSSKVKWDNHVLLTNKTGREHWNRAKAKSNQLTNKLTRITCFDWFSSLFTFVSYMSSQDRAVKADASAWKSTNSSPQYD